MFDNLPNNQTNNNPGAGYPPVPPQPQSPPQPQEPSTPPLAPAEDMFSATDSAAATDRSVLATQVHPGNIDSDKSREIQEFVRSGPTKKSLIFKILFTILGLAIIAFVVYFALTIFVFPKMTAQNLPVIELVVTEKANVDTESETVTEPVIDATDTDEDGLTNQEEEKLGTDRQKADTDSDGLTDYAEVRTYFTNPLDPDTDGDLEMDGKEIRFGTNPLKAETNPSDAGAVTNSTNTVSATTAIAVADSDADGLTDSEEAILGTNPMLVDSDADGLTDSEEIKTYKTNPLKADTDGDGYSDGDEIKNGYNPLGEGKL